MRRILLCFSFVWSLFLFTSPLVAAPYPESIAAWSGATKAKQIEAGAALLARIDAAVERGEQVIRTSVELASFA
jgi:hypothetical protein